MSDAPKLKDFFTVEVVTAFGERTRAVAPHFGVEAFAAAVLDSGWADATFTQRTRRMADHLWDGLSMSAPAAFDVVVAMLPDELAPLDGADGVLNDGFWMWPLGDLIAAHGADHPDVALDACEELTKRFTAEFAVRPILAAHPDAMDRVDRWARHSSEHVRRLASEGTRPRLPWATRLELPFDRVIAVLNELRSDPSIYVRRSVANHLNDLAKDHGERVIELLADWHGEGVDETTWIVRHALRNHLKQGDPRVMALFGYLPAVVGIEALAASPESVAIGESVTVEFDLSGSVDDQQLMIDLVVGYVKANGAVAPKVFKFKDFVLAAETTQRCTKRFDMVVRSTRKLYPGRHSVTIRVNGDDVASTHFELER